MSGLHVGSVDGAGLLSRDGASRFTLDGRSVDETLKGLVSDGSVLQSWLVRSVPIKAGTQIGPVDSPDTHVHFLRRGWAGQMRVLTDGRCQIVSLVLPGEHSRSYWEPDGDGLTPLHALTACEVASIHKSHVREAAQAHPCIRRWLRRAAIRRQRTQTEWLISMGRRSALERLAHLICETVVRQGDRPGACDLPLTQSDLADILGLSVVHVNRVVRQLREMGLAQVERGRVKVCNPAGLRRLAGFDAGYLKPR